MYVVVAGTNYYVKVKLSSGECIHAKIFKPLPHTGLGPNLTDVHASTFTAEDPLTFF